MKKKQYILQCICMSLMLSSHALIAQNYAGPDTTVCQGEGATLGLASAPDDFCYHWTPATGLSSTFEKQPTANPGQTTEYTVVAIGPNFSNKIVDKVKVTVSTGGVTTTPSYTEPNGEANQSQARLTSKQTGVNYIWSIESDNHHGCEIDEMTGKIGGCDEFGDITIRATVDGNPECYAEGTFRINAGVKEVFVIDNDHPTRKATNSDTLHLVGHNDVRIKAIVNDGETFGEDQPDWTGSTVLPPDPHAVEWLNEEGSLGVFLFKAGEKKAYVQRHQPLSATAGGFNHTLATIFNAIGNYLKPPDETQRGYKFSELQTSACNPYKAEYSSSVNYEYNLVERKDRPELGTNHTLEGEISATATGKICFPPPYSSVPNPLFMYSTYVTVQGAAALNVSMSKDESKNYPAKWIPNDVTSTSSVKIGVGGEIGLFVPGDIFGVTGSVFGGVAASMTVGANADSVSFSAKIEPLVIEGGLKVWYLNPNNLVIDLKGKYNILDVIAVPPRRVIDLSSY